MHKPLSREKRQFAVLYSRFLLRVVDLESLSVQADVTKLLGQIAAILVMFSLINGLEPLIPGIDRMPPTDRIPVIWNLLHRMIATTMLVVGLFAVLSWDSTFPDRRDVMVFAPLPVRPRTLFFARIGAAGTMLCLAMLALNIVPGLIWPLIFSSHGLAGTPRFFAAYWVTILASGTFLYGSVLTVQGVTAHLLPRRHFLRLSAFLQIACFCLFLAVYFLQPPLAAPKALASPANHRLLCCLPSYWFLGFLHALNGSTPRAPAFLVARGWAGLAIAVFGAGTALTLSYYRTLRRIVEEPDIVPGAGAVHWPLRFALSLRGTIALFSLRSLLRSRQHRVVVAFWLGVGFALALSCLSIPAAQPPPGSNISPVSLRFIISTVVMMSFAVMGVRVAFSLPVTLPANWIFRMTELRSPQEYVAAVRWSLLVLAVIPVLAGSALLALPFEPLRQIAAHLTVLALTGGIFTEIALIGFHRIPFTCSHLPGKVNVSFAFWAYLVVIIPLTDQYARFEQQALRTPGGCVMLLASLVVLLACFRWWTGRQVGSEALHFSAVPRADIQTLGLQRD